MASTDAALAMAPGDDDAREWAWKSLESSAASRVDAPGPGRMEPNASRRV